MQKKLRRLFIQFVVYCCADVLAFSALNFTLNLQSSINVEGGLGTTSLAVTFTTAIAFGFLTTPLILRKLGPRIGLVISVSTITIFIAANYYPIHATMIPASVMLGVSEGTIWPSLVLMNVYFGNEYSILHNRADLSQHYVNLFSGCFFTAHHLNQVFGGIAGYFLLTETGGNPEHQNTYENGTVANPTVQNVSYEFCGANDCQIDSDLNEIITNYVPTDRYKFIVMISIFVAMSISAATLHGCVLPRRRSKGSIRSTCGDDIDAECKIADSCEKRDSVEKVDEDSVKFVKKSHRKRVKRVGVNICASMRAILRQLLRPKQLLLLPITFYHGLLTAFILSEIPRAYVSCIRGYASISLYSCVFGFAHVSSCIVGKFTKRIGRPYILTVAMILDLANLTFCLLWKPDINTSWMIYICYFVFGMTDGTWQLALNLSHVTYFPESREEAGSVWVTFLNLGLGVQFAWSTALCEYVKIYAMIGTLVFGMILYYAAERMHITKMSSLPNPNAVNECNDFSVEEQNQDTVRNL